MNGLENEKVVIESDDKCLKLTNYRIRYYYGRSENSDMVSIPLNKITSIHVTSRLRFWLLIIGIITIPLLVGIMILYFVIKRPRHVIEIRSGNSVMRVEIQQMSREYVDDFINEVERASLTFSRL